MIGHEPLAEQILETTSDAVARLLKPGARLIPSALRIYVTPVVVPESVRQKRSFSLPRFSTVGSARMAYPSARYSIPKTPMRRKSVSCAPS